MEDFTGLAINKSNLDDDDGKTSSRYFPLDILCSYLSWSYLFNLDKLFINT